MFGRTKPLEVPVADDALPGRQIPFAVSPTHGVNGQNTVEPFPANSEIAAAREFSYAEDEHRQYLAKNPGGNCGIGGTGVCYA